MFQRGEFQEVFDPPHYELFALRDKVSLKQHVYFLLKTSFVLIKSLVLGHVRRPRSVVRRAPVPAGSEEILVRLTLHPRTSLWLSGLPQLHQNGSRNPRPRQGILGAPPFPRRVTEHVASTSGFEQQSSEKELAQYAARQGPGATQFTGATGQSDGRGRRGERGRQVRRVCTQSGK